MPDKWGRIGYNDFLGIAKGVSTIQAMGQRKQLFNQQQEDREAGIQDKEDYESNLAAMGAGPQQARPHEVNGEYVSPEKLEQPVAKFGSASVQAAATETYGKDLQNKQTISGIEDSNELKSATSKASAFLSQNGVDAITTGVFSENALLNQQAQTLAIKAHRETKEAQERLKTVNLEADKKTFAILQTAIQSADRKMAAGDMEGVAYSLMGVSDQIGVPYRLRNYNAENGTLEKQYLDSKSDGHKTTETVKIQNLMTQFKSLNEEKFSGFMDMTRNAIIMGNEESQLHPKHAKTQDGEEYLISSMKNIKDPSQIHYSVRNAKTNNVEMFNSKVEMAKRYPGLEMENLEREESKSKIGASDALTGQRNAARDFDIKRTAALGEGGKFKSRNYYDGQGNQYSATSQAMAGEYEKKGWTIENPKQNKEMYENNVKAFAIQHEGFTTDTETDAMSGIVTKSNYSAVLKTANDLGLSLVDQQGVELDTNGMWPGGKEQAFKVAVMPMGTGKSGGTSDTLDEVSKFDSDAGAVDADDVVDPAVGAVANANNDTKTNAMGDKADTIIKQMSKDEIKDVYRFGAFDEPGTTPWTALQKVASGSQSDKYEKFGEGSIEKALRDAGIETDLQKQKTIAKTLQSKFPKATEAQIVGMISKSVSGNKAKTPAGKTNQDVSPIQAPKLAPGSIPEKTRNQALKGKGISNPKGTDHGYGPREDGTNKGLGYFGELKLPGGKGIATEVSMTMDLFDDGKDILLPALVPTLSKKEIDSVLNHMAGNGEIMQSVYKKAGQWAMDRLAKGKSPFAEDGEQETRSIKTAALGRN